MHRQHSAKIQVRRESPVRCIGCNRIATVDVLESGPANPLRVKQFSKIERARPGGRMEAVGRKSGWDQTIFYGPSLTISSAGA
jgi:hypothetical protein